MFIDFIIGLTLMNAMPHFILGVWKGRMFSAFGFGNKQNIAYSILNFMVSISLFHFKYGISTIAKNGIFLGAFFVLVIYLTTGHLWYKAFNKNSESL